MTENPFHYTTILKFSPDGVPINYDCWSEIHWKAKLEGDLTAPEAQELMAPEETNMPTIGDVYDAQRSDADVGEWIERLRGHELRKVMNNE